MNRLTATALAGLSAVVFAACGGANDPEPEDTSVAPATIVSVATPAFESAVDLQTTQATTYYPVAGTTTEEIFASIEANGPTDNTGQQGSGLTSVDWEYKWSGDQLSSGECTVRELTLRADITVELPQHVDEASLSPRILENWRAYTLGVAEHEQTHVDIYLEGAEDIRNLMEGIGIENSCDELEALIDSIWKSEQERINGLQHTFHAEEDERLVAARGPLEGQIEQNRAELQSLQSQIAAVDEQITELRGEIAGYDSEVANIDGQIKQINDQFPNQLPPTIRDRLEQLIEQSNDLLISYNERVDEHNNAIFQRNALSEQYDALLAETNALVDQYNWTR